MFVNALFLSLLSYFTYFLYAVINFPPYVFINTLCSFVIGIVDTNGRGSVGTVCLFYFSFLLILTAINTLFPPQGPVKFHLISFSLKY